MATIKKRTNGKYTAEIRKKGVTKSKTFPSKRLAQSWASTEELKIESGQITINTNKTLSEILNDYADKYGKNRKHINDLHKIGSHSIGSMLVKYITTADCQDWIDWRNNCVSPNSVLREISTLNPVLNHCKKVWKYIEENPLSGTKRPKPAPARKRRTSPEEEDAILNALFHDKHAPLKDQRDVIANAFLFSLENGMRQGEIWGIKPEHIFMEQDYVYLPKTKNGEERDVFLTDEAKRLIQRGLDFSPAKPFPYPQNSCGAIFRGAVKMAGVLDYTFHDTRHEACTRLARKLDMLDLAKTIGHKDVRSLMIYYNPTATEIAEQVRKKGTS